MPEMNQEAEAHTTGGGAAAHGADGNFHKTDANGNKHIIVDPIT
jgi:hypothetical protein